MTDLNQSGSVRQLAPGKLTDIKKIFEDGENKIVKQDKPSPPVRPPPPPAGKVTSPVQHQQQQPVSRQPQAKPPTVQPPPPPLQQQQQASPAAAQTAHQKHLHETGVQQTPDASNRTSSAAAESPKPAQQARPASKLNPSVTGRFSTPLDSTTPSQHDDKGPDKHSSVVHPIRPAIRPFHNSTSVGDATHMDNPQQEKTTKVAPDPSEFYSKVNKPNKNAEISPRKVMFSPEDKPENNITRREAMRKNTVDRRKTVAGLGIESAETGSNAVNIAERSKLFDKSKGDKPDLPQKPDSVKRKFSMRTQKEYWQQQQNDADNGDMEADHFYNPPWDKNSFLEKLKKNQSPLPQIAVKADASNQSNASNTPKADVSNQSNASHAPLIKAPITIISLKKPDPAPTKTENQDNEVTSTKNPPPQIKPESTTGDSPLHKKGPPPKPPRTHAHDDYLKVKVPVSHIPEAKPFPNNTSTQVVANNKKPGETAGQNNKKPGESAGQNNKKPGESAGQNKPGETSGQNNKKPGESAGQNNKEFLSVKDRISKIQQQGDSSASPSPLPLPSCSFDVKNTEQAANTRQPAPSRPPPPRRRPNSSDQPADLTTSCDSFVDYPKADNGGPIIIPLSPRNKLTFVKQRSNVQELRTRNPNDDLPPEPDSMKKFPLRKSYSSECLHSSRSSSLNGELEDENGMSALSRNSCGSQYEAVIDADGYAVPNMFLRMPGGQSDSIQNEHFRGPPKFQLKRDGALIDRNDGGQVIKTTSTQDQSLNKVNKKNMTMVKQKINQAYADIDFIASGTRESSEFQIIEPDPEGETVMEPSVLKKRIDYCTSVRLNANRTVKRSKDYLDAIYPQLFEYCLIVGLRPLVDTNGYEPFVIHKFPENASSNLSVPNFCFPDASIFKPGSATFSESYSFVMTHSDGSRMYGYCRRLQPPDSSLPEVICIISPVDAFNMYNFLLSEIEKNRRISLDQASELIAASFGRPLPKPGKVCHIRTLDDTGEMETIFLNRSADNRLENVNYESPLHYLGTERLVKVFSSMLMERRIILCSSNLSILTQTVHALSALLYPFQWQHVYIPLLPCDMLEVVRAPVPFIVGVLSAFLPRVLKMDLEEVFIVDLDKKNIVKSQNDESTILPKRVQKALKTAINMCKIDAEARNAQWLMVAEAFLRVFIETVGHFNSHMGTLQDGKKVFQKNAFITEVVSKEVREFLSWFTETQMFEVFITNHIEMSDFGTSDLFLQRLGEHKELKEQSGAHKGIGAKVKSFGKALKTKLQSS